MKRLIYILPLMLALASCDSNDPLNPQGECSVPVIAESVIGKSSSEARTIILNKGYVLDIGESHYQTFYYPDIPTIDEMVSQEKPFIRLIIDHDASIVDDVSAYQVFKSIKEALTGFSNWSNYLSKQHDTIAIWYSVINCFDENNNCEGHAFLEGERSDEYKQKYLPEDKHLGNRADYEKMLVELKRSKNNYQIREWFFDIDDENNGTEIKCEYSTKGIPFSQYPIGHSQSATSSSKPNHTAKFFMNTGNRDKDVNSLIDALQHYIQ